MDERKYIESLLQLCKEESYIPKKFELFEWNKYWIGYVDWNKEIRLRTMDNNFITF
jgi:hypothetical protein